MAKQAREASPPRARTMANKKAQRDARMRAEFASEILRKAREAPKERSKENAIPSPKEPERRVTAQDIVAVNGALSGLVLSLMATDRLAYLGTTEICSKRDSEALFTVVREVVRRFARIADTCVQRLGGMPMGGFDDALRDDD